MTNSKIFLTKLSESIFKTNILEFLHFPKICVEIILFISSFQTFTLTLQGYDLIAWKSGSSIQYFYRGIYEYTLNLIDVDLKDIDPIYFWFLVTAALYISTILVFHLYLLYKIAKKKPLPKIVSDYFVLWSHIHALLVFLPFNHLVSSLYSKIIEDINYFSAQYYLGLMATLSTCWMINILTALSLCLWTTKIKTENLLSRPSDEYIFLTIIQKIIVPILFWGGKMHNQTEALCFCLNFMNFFLFIFMFAKFTKCPPFYSQKMSRIIYYTNAVSLTVSTFNIIAQLAIRDGNDFSQGLHLSLCIFLSPFLIVIIQNSKRSQKNSVLHNMANQSEYTQCIYLRKLRKILVENQSRKDPKSFNDKELYEHTLRQKIKDHLKFESQSDLGDFYCKIALRRHIPHAVSLTIADCLVRDCKFVSQAYVICKKLFSDPTSNLSTKLTAQVLMNEIQNFLAFNQSDKLELLNFMRSINDHNDLSDLIEKAMAFQEIFYKILQSINPNYENLYSILVKVQETKKKIENLWKNITFQGLLDYPFILKLYGYYKIFVEKKSESGKEFLSKYKDLIQKRHHYRKNIQYSMNDIYLIISLENEKFGHITNCTLNVKNVFGYSARELTGKNISTIIPNPAAKVHDDLIRSRLKDPEKIMEFKKIEVMGLHKLKYIFPVQTKFTIYPSLTNGLSYWCMIKKVHQQCEFMIINKRGEIEAVSQGIKDSIRVKLDQRLHLATICSFDEYGQKSMSFDFENLSTVRNNKKTPTREIKNSQLNHFSKLMMNYVEECSDSNIEFGLEFHEYVLRRNKISSYLCSVEPKNYGPNQIYLVTMMKNQTLQTQFVYEKKVTPYEELSDTSEGPTRLEVKMVSSKVNKFNDDGEMLMSRIDTERPFLLESPRIFGKRRNPIPQNSTLSIIHSDKKKEMAKEEDWNISDLSNELKKERTNSSKKLRLAKQEKKFHEDIDGIIRSSRFYKVPEGYVLKLFILIFLVSLFSSIIVMFLESKKSIKQIHMRFQSFNHLTVQGEDIGIMANTLSQFYIWHDLIMDPSKTFESSRLFVEDANSMITATKNFKETFNELSDSEKLFFFFEDLKMHTEQFQSVPNNSIYQYVDIFHLSNSIHSEASFLAQNYMQMETQEISKKFDFLFSNLLNDIWIKIIQSPNILRKSMNERVESILYITKSLYLMTIVFFLVLVMVLIHVKTTSYRNRIEVFNILIQAGKNTEINDLLKELSIFKSFLCQKIRENEVNMFENAKKNSNIFLSKHRNNTSLLFKMLSRLIILSLLPLGLFLLLDKSERKLVQAIDKVLPSYDNIFLLAKIILKGMPIITYENLLLIRPNTYVENILVEQRIDDAITEFRDSVSFSNKISSSMQNLLSQNYCPYFVQTTLFPECNSVFQSFATKGVINSVIALAEFQEQYRKVVSDITKTPQNIYNLTFDRLNQEASYLLTSTLRTTLSNYKLELQESLVNELHDSSDSIISIILPCVILCIFGLIPVYIIMIIMLQEERRNTIMVFCVVPLQFVMREKVIREYLIKFSKGFYLLVKNYNRYVDTDKSSRK